MPTLMPTLNAAVFKAFAIAVSEQDTPLSAWPEKYPGRWALVGRVAELSGLSTAVVNVHCRDLVAAGKLIAERPWPGNLRGYQLAGQPDATPLFAIPDETPDVRQWLLDELRRWGDTHGGRPPYQTDWTERRDPEREWPRAGRVIEFFEREAKETGARYFLETPCDCIGPCSRSHQLDFCRCSHPCGCGKHGNYSGLSGWAYALELAGYFR